MRSSRDRKQAAIAAVAKHFRATAKQGADPGIVHLAVAGKRVVLDVEAIEAQVSARSGIAPPRLRFDRVALGLIERLRTTALEVVPIRRMAVVTVTAPIRLDSKTTAVLEGYLRALAGKPLTKARLVDTVHGNRIEIRILRSGEASITKLAGFVHNGDSDPAILFSLSSALLRRYASAGRAGKGRWLVIGIEDPPAWTKTYRQVCAQLFAETHYQRVLLVGADGEVSRIA